MISSNWQPAGEVPSLPEADYGDFQQEVERLSGIRLNLYKPKQMKRRIDTLIARRGFTSYRDYAAFLRENPEELRSFLSYITINVTEFFRTPDQWSGFEQYALSGLTQNPDVFPKIWSCACSTGEEVYSLAMSMYSLTGNRHFSILGTDIDEDVLKKAKTGEYDRKSTEQVPEKLREKFFTGQGSRVSVCKPLTECTEFARLDLLRDPYPQDCDVIVCRNVLIYFTEEAKTEIYTRFRDSLKQGGYLFTGNTEQIVYYKSFGLKKITGYLYQKL